VDLMRHDDPHVREAAFDAIVDLGEPALDVLADLTGDDEPERRWLAYEAIRRIHSAAAIAALLAGLHDEEFGIRWLASDGLIELGEPAYVPLLQAIVHEEPDLRFHQAAGRVVRRIALPEHEQAVDALAASLTRGTSEVESGPLALELLNRIR
jgi:HEAT repeat protein